MKKPWTTKDLDDLRELAAKRKNHRLDWGMISRRFPDRSRHSIFKKMTVHGMTDPQAWSVEEDRILRDGWNECRTTTLVSRLKGRTKGSIYERALRLGLRAGPPQGMVSVSSLALSPKWGYDYYKTLQILAFAKVSARALNYAGLKKTGGVLYVDHLRAIEAAASWEKHKSEKLSGKETPIEAARRLRCRSATMWEWLTKASLVSEKSEKKREFFATPDVYDRVEATYRQRKRSPLKASQSESKGQSQPQTPLPQRSRRSPLEVFVARRAVQRRSRSSHS